MQDAQEAEDKIAALQDQLVNSRAETEVAKASNNLDVKKQIERIKADFEKDQEKAAKKITKLTKKVEELEAATEEQTVEISALTNKLKEMKTTNEELTKKVEKFSGDAQELVKVREVLIERTKILKETSREF